MLGCVDCARDMGGARFEQAEPAGAARVVRADGPRGRSVHPFPAVASAHRLRGLYATVVGPRRDVLGRRVPSTLDRAGVDGLCPSSTR